MKHPLQWRYADGRIDRLPDPPRRIFSPEESYDILSRRCELASAGLRESCRRGLVRWMEFGPTVAPDGPRAGDEIAPGGSCFIITAPTIGFGNMSDEQIIAFLTLGSELAQELEELGQEVEP